MLEAQNGRPSTIVERAAAAARRSLLLSICRHLIGDVMAQALNIARTSWHPVVGALRSANQITARINRLPVWRNFASMLGDRYWSAAVTGGLARR